MCLQNGYHYYVRIEKKIYLNISIKKTPFISTKWYIPLILALWRWMQGYNEF